MKTSLKIHIFLIMSLLFLLVSCKKKLDFPDTPVIKYDSFTKISNDLGYDDKGILKITFTDGDGNIGLSPGDTLPPFNPDGAYYYNFFISYFEKQNGVFKEITLPFSNSARIPVINANGINKALKGSIEIELYINNYLSSYDTILFKTYIVDRSLNLSNIIETPEIIIKK